MTGRVGHFGHPRYDRLRSFEDAEVIVFGDRTVANFELSKPRDFDAPEMPSLRYQSCLISGALVLQW
jgi:hypothetical protein